MRILLKGFLICSLVAQTHAFTDALYNLFDVTNSQRESFENGDYYSAIRSYLDSYLGFNYCVGKGFFSQGIWHGGIAGGLLASQLGKFENNNDRLNSLGVGVGTGIVGACITHFIIRRTPWWRHPRFVFLSNSMPDKQICRAYGSGFLISAIVSCVTTKLAQYVHKKMKQ
jgi:hypothetical protein